MAEGAEPSFARLHRLLYGIGIEVILGMLLLVFFAAQAGREALFVLAVLTLVVTVAAAIVLRQGDAPGTQASVFNLQRGSSYIVVGALALGAVLAVRLSSTRQFGGNIVDLDFGPKEDGSDNKSFTAAFASYGHFLQGMLVLFLCDLTFLYGLNPVLLHLKDMAALCIVIYPLYNNIKRTAKAGTTFAVSSVSNNSTEWFLGFVLGLALCALISAIDTRRYMPGPRPQDPRSPRVLRRMYIARVAAGLVLCGVAAWASFSMMYTWDRTQDGVPQHNDSPLGRLFVVLLPAFVFLLGVVRAYRLRLGVDPATGRVLPS